MQLDGLAHLRTYTSAWEQGNREDDDPARSKLRLELPRHEGFESLDLTHADTTLVHVLKVSFWF